MKWRLPILVLLIGLLAFTYYMPLHSWLLVGIAGVVFAVFVFLHFRELRKLRREEKENEKS